LVELSTGSKAHDVTTYASDRREVNRDHERAADRPVARLIYTHNVSASCLPELLLEAQWDM
jgi:hypothetical protein